MYLQSKSIFGIFLLNLLKKYAKMAPMVTLSIPQRKSLFWDTNPAMLDAKQHANYIIERILDFGNDNEVKWLFQQYSTNDIKQVVQAPRSQLHRKSKALWELVLR